MIYPQNRTHGLWSSTAKEAPTTLSLSKHFKIAVLIVGAGYSGLACALSLRNAGRDVAVLEAGILGRGCSGRNGGQVNPGWKMDPATMELHYGSTFGAQAKELAKMAVPNLSNLIKTHKLDCDFIEQGYVQASPNQKGVSALKQRASQWNDLGCSTRLLDQEETAKLLGTQAYEGALLHEQGGNLQPLSYARELARVAIEAGAEIFTSSPALKLEPCRAGWRVTTPQGSIEAARVVLATNGYTDTLWPGLKRSFVRVASVLSATAPLPLDVATTLLPGLHSVSETKRIQVYYRKTVDNRFVIGGMGPVWGPAKGGSTRDIRKTAQDYFPQLAGMAWEFDWAGTVAMTWDHAPKLMQLAQGLFSGLGYNGRGVAMATTMGDQLAKAVLGQETSLPVTGLYQTPFHRFRKFGVFYTVKSGRFFDALEKRN